MPAGANRGLTQQGSISYAREFAAGACRTYETLGPVPCHRQQAVLVPSSAPPALLARAPCSVSQCEVTAKNVYRRQNLENG